MIARSLHQSLWFHEVRGARWRSQRVGVSRPRLISDRLRQVDWSDSLLKDGAGKVYAFLQDEHQDTSDFEDLYEIPTGVLTSVTPCLSPYCGKLNEEGYSLSCYSYTCPNKAKVRYFCLAFHRTLANEPAFPQNNLQRQASTLSATSGSEPVSHTRLPPSTTTDSRSFSAGRRRELGHVRPEISARVAVEEGGSIPESRL
jgi:hypothetical protein